MEFALGLPTIINKTTPLVLKMATIVYEIAIHKKLILTDSI